MNVSKKRMIKFYTPFNYVMEKGYDGPSVKEKINLDLFSFSHLVLRKKGIGLNIDDKKVNKFDNPSFQSMHTKTYIRFKVFCGLERSRVKE